MMVGLLPTAALAAPRPYGDNPQEAVNYYIAVNDTYQNKKGTVHGAVYGYGILRAEISSCEVVDGDKVGQYNDRTYNIELKSDTVGDASFDLVFDVGCDSGGNTVPVLNNSPGLSGMAKILNYGALMLDEDANILGTTMQLENGMAQLTLYVYADAADGVPTVHAFNFSIAQAETTDDPAPEDVVSIAITTPPSKTTYFAGQTFDRAGMVVTATLTDGSTAPVAGYEIAPDGPLTELGENAVTISFGGHTATQTIEVLPSAKIGDVRITNGQFLSDYEWNIYDHVLVRQNNTFSAVVLYGEANGIFTFRVGDGAEVYIGGDEQAVDADGLCTLSLPTSTRGVSTVVTLKAGTSQTDYAFNCYSQIESGMPTAVVDYLCIASQYTNGSGIGPYGVNAVATLSGGADVTSGSTTEGPASLGNFGGYITYYYEDAITDNPNNPYGVDFVVIGNSYNGSGGFAEPGNVLVSEDGKTWYALAGSVHYDNNAIWDYEVTYENKGRAAWKDNRGQEGTMYYYPVKEYYPLFLWTPELENKITLTGVLLTPQKEQNEYGNTLPPFPDFGYVDVGRPFSSASIHPYAGLDASGAYKPQQDSFDLKWAVDAGGLPVDLSDADIHYVKVQTASFIDNGGIGEKSTEVNGMVAIEPGASAVGVTAAPTGITVDSKVVTVPGANLGVVNDVEISGAFVVNVDAPEGANVYINSSRSTSATFAQMPMHEMLRIIVQEGEKEPWIGYFNLVEGATGEDDKYTVITFDPAGGTIAGASERTYTPDTPDKTFPVPTWANRTFLGWYDANGNKYDSYSEDMPAALTLTARWQYIIAPGESNTVNVTFRLIGATKSGVIGGNSDIDLGKPEGYKSSKYVTWIATRPYTMNKGATMYDLFVKAIADAGLHAEGQDTNYVKTIYAPSVLGGYALSEFTNGQRSGWMYTVGKTSSKEAQKHPSRGLLQYDLQDSDVVIWHYVNDYAYEVADWAELGGPEYPVRGDSTYWNEWLEAEDRAPNPSDASGGAPLTSTGSSTLTPKTTAANGVASVTISPSGIASFINDAKTKNSASITIAPDITGQASKVSVDIPKSSLSSIASETDASLTVKTPVGSITIPNGAMASITSQATGGTVTVSLASIDKSSLTVEQRDVVGDHPVYDINIISAGENISRFAGDSITISLPYTLKEGEDPDNVTVWYLNDKGELEKITCTYDPATGLATFTTDHLSYYLVGHTEETPPPVPGQTFSDVTSIDWFYDSVTYAVYRKLMNGTSPATFSPNDPMNRAMLVTVLHRLEGSPQVTGESSFTDVKDNQWYTDPVTWASTNNIITGYGISLFGTDDPVTREQMATILHRYASYKSYDVSKTTDLTSYTDAPEINTWALDAMQWANAEGLITGRTATTLAPGGTATRAEVATILIRFVEGVVK